MDWNDLKTLLAVARAGSIAAAAKELGVSHSTVYRKVKAFEDEHRLSLFERHQDGYRLAEAGGSFIEAAERVEAAVADVSRKLRSYGEEALGTVSIATPEAAALLLCPRLAPLMSRFPQLTLEWNLEADAASLINRECDIAIVAASEPPPTLVGRRLADIAFAVYGADHYVEREALDDLNGARWIVFSAALASQPVPAWECQNVPQEAIAMRVNRRVMLDEAVLAGIGVGVMPRLTGDAYPKLRRLSDNIDVSLPLWVLTHPDLRDAPGVRTVFDTVVELLADHAESASSGT